MCPRKSASGQALGKKGPKLDVGVLAGDTLKGGQI